MKKLLAVSLAVNAVLLAWISLKELIVYADTGDPRCLFQNGDVNGDEALDLGDAVNILMHLFVGGPAPQPQFVAHADCMTILQGELTICKSDLDALSSDLNDCRSSLATSEAELTSCRSDLEESRRNLAAREAELAEARAALVDCQTNLAAKDSELTDCRRSLSDREAELSACTVALESCRNAYGLPATGQTKCYSCRDMGGNVVDCANPDFIGQDGFYQAGCPKEGRFMDNGNGTLTDTCTGLMWQQDTADISGNGSVGDEDRVTPCQAFAYCENLSFAGHDDWRLPNVRELQSIVDYGRFNPSIDPVFKALPDWYWSSSALASDTVYSLMVQFYVGYVEAYGTGGGIFFVRAVRGGL